MVRVEINIEICSNCKEHAWCTRHNEATYLSLAEELQKSIKNQRESAIVNILKVGGHKMGSFEVSCNGVALFSKLALGYFPHTALLTNRIMQFIDDSEHGKDLAKYRHNLSPMKYNPNFKQSSSQSPEKNPSNPNLPAHNEEKPKQEEAKRENKSSIVNVQKPSNTSVKVQESHIPHSNQQKSHPKIQKKAEVHEAKPQVKETRKVTEVKEQPKHVEKIQEKKDQAPVKHQEPAPEVEKAIEHQQVKPEVEKSHHEIPKNEEKPQEPKKQEKPHHEETVHHQSKPEEKVLHQPKPEEKPHDQSKIEEHPHHQTPKKQQHIEHPKKEQHKIEGVHHAPVEKTPQKEPEHTEATKKQAEVAHKQDHSTNQKHKQTVHAQVKQEPEPVHEIAKPNEAAVDPIPESIPAQQPESVVIPEQPPAETELP